MLGQQFITTEMSRCAYSTVAKLIYGNSFIVQQNLLQYFGVILGQLFAFVWEDNDMSKVHMTSIIPFTIK